MRLMKEEWTVDWLAVWQDRLKYGLMDKWTDTQMDGWIAKGTINCLRTKKWKSGVNVKSNMDQGVDRENVKMIDRWVNRWIQSHIVSMAEGYNSKGPGIDRWMDKWIQTVGWLHNHCWTGSYNSEESGILVGSLIKREKMIDRWVYRWIQSQIVNMAHSYNFKGSWIDRWKYRRIQTAGLSTWLEAITLKGLWIDGEMGAQMNTKPVWQHG